MRLRPTPTTDPTPSSTSPSRPTPPAPRGDKGKRTRDAVADAGVRAAVRGKLARAGLGPRLLEQFDDAAAGTYKDLSERVRDICRSL